MTDSVTASTHAFLHLWGEMASQWGISRSMAQVYALLYLSNEALDTEEIMERLAISRGNANINIRKLLEWELVYKAERPDTRRDFFQAEKDVWTVTARIIEERHKRELRPVLGALEKLVEEASNSEDPNSAQQKEFRNQLKQMASLLYLVDDILNALLPLIRNRSSDEVKQLISFIQRSQNFPD